VSKYSYIDLQHEGMNQALSIQHLLLATLRAQVFVQAFCIAGRQTSSFFAL